MLTNFNPAYYKEHLQKIRLENQLNFDYTTGFQWRGRFSIANNNHGTTFADSNDNSTA